MSHASTIVMLTYSVRNVLLRRFSICKTSKGSFAVILRFGRGWCDTTNVDEDQAGTLLKLSMDRGYISPNQTNGELFKRGVSCSYGPLGTELKRNLLEKWWGTVVGSRGQVFGINSPSCMSDRAIGGLDRLRVVDHEKTMQILEQQELRKEQLVQQVLVLLQKSGSLRTNFLQGALEQFVPSFELVSRKLPFGLAETGVCFQPSDGSGCPVDVTQTSLVWFCSPRTSSQWLDYWARQRLQWWRKFALGPSDFSSRDVLEQELEQSTSRGVKIFYNFPWGLEPLETLWNRGDAELLQAHSGVRSKLQCRDGRKSVPHVVTVTANMDRGVMAILFNSLQRQKREDSKKKLHQRKVLKLHPVLAPIKVALDIGKGATMELRQVCEGLLQELLEAKISTWPGYLETVPTSLEQLNAKYDEMGVLFTTVINENTLESGLLQVRSRDTAIRETMHISEIKNFLSKYVSAAEHI